MIQLKILLCKISFYFMIKHMGSYVILLFQLV